MYRIEDTVSAIKEVQRLLQLNQTGIYDKNTGIAVNNIQRIYSLKEAEEVDYDTFRAIVAEYKKSKSKSSNSNYLFNPVFPYKLDDMDENVRLINDAMIPVLNDYTYEGRKPNGKYLNFDTIDAANFLRIIFRMNNSEEIDEAFVNRLLLEKKAIEEKIRYGN